MDNGFKYEEQGQFAPKSRIHTKPSTAPARQQGALLAFPKAVLSATRTLPQATWKHLWMPLPKAQSLWQSRQTKWLSRHTRAVCSRKHVVRSWTMGFSLWGMA